jgi:molecular chaperone GrpE (heat shock protein)
MFVAKYTVEDLWKSLVPTLNSFCGAQIEQPHGNLQLRAGVQLLLDLLEEFLDTIE